MKFEEILPQIRKGSSFYREQWVWRTRPIETIELDKDGDIAITYTSIGEEDKWTPTSQDLLAEDWVLWRK